jgi:hypothetical protein
MKKFIANLAVVLLASWGAKGQGTTYLSNLGQTPVTPLGIGNNSWLAAAIHTGPNTGGYLLDSIQLAMADEYSAGGTPSNFTVLLYANATSGRVLPENNLGALSGSADPATAGIYAYTPASSLILSPSTLYSIVLTAGSPFIRPNPAGGPVNDTGYVWNCMTSGTPFVYNPSGSWFSPYTYSSTDGLNWNEGSGLFPQFSLTAEPVPEPGVFGLLILGGLPLLRYCLKHKDIS